MTMKAMKAMMKVKALRVTAITENQGIEKVAAVKAMDDEG